MIHRLASLVGLLDSRYRLALLAAVVFGMAERLLWAATAIGLVGSAWYGWAAGIAAAGISLMKAAISEPAQNALRRKLAMALVAAPFRDPLAAETRTLEQAEATVFEGRYAAEQVVLKFLPSLIADVLAFSTLVLLVRPLTIPVAVAAAVALAASLTAVFIRRLASVSVDRAWEKHLLVARGLLTSTFAAHELVASGNEDAHVAGVGRRIDEWARAAARADRVTALFERLPVYAVGILALVIVAYSTSASFADLVRLAVFVPPLAGAMRTSFGLIRSAPKIREIANAIETPESEPSTQAATIRTRAPCVIRFESVDFTYATNDDSPAILRGVTFEWKPGAVLGIRGPNGSGKSTVLKLMLGLLTPSAGRIQMDGNDLSELDLRYWRQHTAYLPQRPYLPEHWTVRDALAITVPNLSDDDARAALEQTQVWARLARSGDGPERALDTLVGRLSSGERQRVLLARVLARRSTLALLDEPDEYLDKQGRDLLARFVRHLAATRMVALVAHDEVVLGLADVVVDLTPSQHRLSHHRSTTGAG